MSTATVDATRAYFAGDSPGDQNLEAVVAAFPTDDEDRPVFVTFPEHAHRLRLLLDVDEDFSELCDDFDAVAAAYHRSTHDSELRPAADEYHSLRIELEAEILEWLRHGAKPGSTRG